MRVIDRFCHPPLSHCSSTIASFTKTEAIAPANRPKRASAGIRTIRRSTPWRLSCLQLFWVAAILWMTAASGWAAQVTLAWDASSSVPNGYRLFQRTENQAYDYTKPVWSGSATTCTVDQLSDGTRYYFVVRAYNAVTESADSNEISYDTPASDHAPTADAGGDQTVSGGLGVTLNGSASADPDGDTLSYTWTQTAGTAVQLSDPHAVQPTFTAPNAAVTLSFKLTVSDPSGLSAADTCAVQVTTPTNTPPTDTAPVSGGDGNTSGSTSAQNQPPLQPSLIYPADGDSAVELAPQLEASAFADPDAGDTHAQTEWIISAQSDGHTVLDVTRTGSDLAHLQVPELVLDPATGYVGQVRYFDERGNASPLSAAVSFTTDNTAASGSAAQIAPTQTDLNADGIPDTDESDTLKSVQAPDGQHAVAVGIKNSDNIVALDAVLASDPAVEQTLPADAVPGPYGLLSYRIQVSQPGQEATVALYFSDPIDPNTAWLGKDENGDWTDSSSQMDPQPDGFTVYRRVTDGGPGDADGTANGTIVDQIIPLASTKQADNAGQGADNTASSGSGSSGGGGGGCFIESLMK
jgi:hypothetical protein